MRVEPGYATPREEDCTGQGDARPGRIRTMIPIALAVLIGILALLAFRWFERYRLTEAWRSSPIRDAAFGFILWFGGLFGHRVPPPPRPKIEQASGGSSLPPQAPDKKD